MSAPPGESKRKCLLSVFGVIKNVFCSIACFIGILFAGRRIHRYFNFVHMRKGGGVIVEGKGWETCQCLVKETVIYIAAICIGVI